MKNTPKNKFSPLLHLTYVLQQLTDENLLKSSGISLSHARIMSVLDPSIANSQRHIASYLQQTEANISRQLRVMQRMGLVSIIRNKRDGRQRDVKLTHKGEVKMHLAARLLAEQETELLKLLDKAGRQAFNQATANLLSALNVVSATTRKL